MIEKISKTIPKLVKIIVAAVITGYNKILLEKQSVLIEKGKWRLSVRHIDFEEIALSAIKKEKRRIMIYNNLYKTLWIFR